MRKNLSRCVLLASGTVFFLSLIEINAYSQTPAPDLLNTLPPPPTEEMRQMQNAQQVQDQLQLQKAQQLQPQPKQEQIQQKSVQQKQVQPKQEQVQQKQVQPKQEQVQQKQVQPKQEKAETKEVTQTKEVNQTKEQSQKPVKPPEQQQSQSQTKVEKVEKVEKTKTNEPPQEKNNLQNTPPPEEKNLPTKVKNLPEEGSGLFGSAFRIGPMVGAGVLMGPNVGIEAKIFKYWGLSFSYAQYNNFNIFNVYDFRSQLNNNNRDFTIDSAHINYKQIEGKISWFPWGKTFFIGTAFGKRDITINMGGNVNTTITELGPIPISAPINVKYEVNSLYLTPQIGWLASWDGPYGGFAIGTEFGAQFSISNSETLTPSTSDVYAPYLNELVNTTQYQEMKSQILSQTGEKIKNYPFPYWNIIKVGWLF